MSGSAHDVPPKPDQRPEDRQRDSEIRQLGQAAADLSLRALRLARLASDLAAGASRVKVASRIA